MKKKIYERILRKLKENPLKTICILCLVLALLISWSILLALLVWGNPGRGRMRENSFTRNLREYDLINAPKMIMEGENPGQIERRLLRLQKQARSAEEQLSVLKRRRALAMLDRRFINTYMKAATEASDAYAHSPSLAAVAVEAIVIGSADGGHSGGTLALLKNYLSRISQNRFDMLNLSTHILAGNLSDPAVAAAIPELPELLSLDLSGLPYYIQRDLLTDGILLHAHNGNISGATLLIGNLLNNASIGLNGETIRMAAEFFYDHDNPLRAAELFLGLDDENYFEMAADALAMAGEISGAGNIWLALSAGSDLRNSQTLRRSIYNMASSSSDPVEAESWLERLFTLSREPQSRQGHLNSFDVNSAIRYSRLLDTDRSIAILEDLNQENLNPANPRRDPLLDLELLRRKQPGFPPTRAASEVWMLLGHHSENEELFEWAAWYFEYQKLYPEMERLLKEASRKGMIGAWYDLHRSIALIRERKIADAEKILQARYQDPRSTADWRIAANLGRIQESRRAVSSAIEYYQAAAALVKDRSSAAQVQMRLSRCFEALGHNDESRRAIEQARELDPDNISIRREYARIFTR